MIVKSVATFIYIANSHKASGSPVKLEYTKTVKVDIRQTFSNRYYFERGREMRNAKTIVCNTYNTEDIQYDGDVYSLQYVVMNGIKYSVMAILNNFVNNEDDPYKKVLDLKKAL